MNGIEVTEVRVRLLDRPPVEGKRSIAAFATIVLNESLAIHDAMIIHSPLGPYLAMPNRATFDHCEKCSTKNHMRARFCNHCGVPLDPARLPPENGKGYRPHHIDVVHPVNHGVRALIEGMALAAYRREVKSAGKQVA